jgi:hypothetical protein
METSHLPAHPRAPGAGPWTCLHTRDGAGHSCTQEPVTLRRAAEVHTLQADWERAWITVWSCRILQEPHRNVGVDSLGIPCLRTPTQYLQRALRILSGIQVTLHFLFWGSWPDYTPISPLCTGAKIPKEEYRSLWLSIWERGWDPWGNVFRVSQPTQNGEHARTHLPIAAWKVAGTTQFPLIFIYLWKVW